MPTLKVGPTLGNLWAVNLEEKNQTLLIMTYRQTIHSANSTAQEQPVVLVFHSRASFFNATWDVFCEQNQPPRLADSKATVKNTKMDLSPPKCGRSSAL